MPPHLCLIGLLCCAEKIIGCYVLGLIPGVGLGTGHDLLHKDGYQLSGMKYIPRQGSGLWRVDCCYGPG